MELLNRIYRNPNTGYTGIKELYRRAKARDKSITMNKVKTFLMNQYSAQRHKPIKKIRHYLPITADDVNDVFQIDLMDMKNISTMNKNYKWLFVCVDVFSRFAYVVPMKNKNTNEILNASMNILNKVKPNKIMCDNGSEFTSGQFKKLCSDKNIIINYVDVNNHLIPHIGNRLGIVDRFIQTLRQRIQNYCDDYDTNTYIDVLQDIVNNINDSFNSGIGTVPSNPDKLEIEQKLDEKFVDALKERSKNDFKIGDHVRCIINKNLFEKGSIAKWSIKIYTIKEEKAHSYLLDNGKWYKYYQIIKVNITADDKANREDKLRELRRQNTIQRRLKKEGVELNRIIKRKRKRKPTQRLKY